MAKEWNADDQVFFLNILTTAEQWNFFVIVGGTQISLLVDYARVLSTYYGSIISANTSRLQGLTPGIPPWSGKVNVFDNANANCD